MLLAPDSRGATWDALPAQDGAFGPDIAFISAALAQTFAQYNVNAVTLGVQGFSDGATYALGLGAHLSPLGGGLDYAFPSFFLFLSY